MSDKLGIRTFFTSDLHFGHQKVIEFCNRPFSDVDDMTEQLIKNWNKKVRPQDHVYVLGDVSMYLSVQELKAIISRLNGTKILIRGNHDMQVGQMRNAGFDVVVESAIIYIANRRVVLSHYPYPNSGFMHSIYKLLHKLFPKKFWLDKHRFRRVKDNGHWLLHGHTHSEVIHTPGTRMIHVGVDAWDYSPVELAQIGNIIIESERNK